MEKLELKAKKVSTHNMRKMIPIYAKEKRLMSVTLFFMIVSGVLGVLQPIFSANALASLASMKFEKAIKLLGECLDYLNYPTVPIECPRCERTEDFDLDEVIDGLQTLYREEFGR